MLYRRTGVESGESMLSARDCCRCPFTMVVSAKPFGPCTGEFCPVHGIDDTVVPRPAGPYDVFRKIDEFVQH